MSVRPFLDVGVDKRGLHVIHERTENSIIIATQKFLGFHSVDQFVDALLIRIQDRGALLDEDAWGGRGD
jgi:hypothetical protein